MERVMMQAVLNITKQIDVIREKQKVVNYISKISSFFTFRQK
jgi:hypothetical protein